MTWLNWSLKFHIRLRTISSLVPIYIRHVYAQWMPYLFVWLYLVKYVAHAQLYVDQTQKKRKEKKKSVLIVFGKCFCFENFQNFQKLCNLVLVTCLAGQANRMPQSQAYTEGFHNSPVGQSPSGEKDLEIFPKIWFFRFLATQFGGLFVRGSSSREVYSESFAAPSATSSWVDLLVTKNTWKIFQNFVTRVFGNLLWWLVHDSI